MKFLPHFFWEHLNPFLFACKQKLYKAKLKRLNKRPVKPFKRVLVLAHSAGIGNAVEATPLVQAIRMLWPECHLTFFPPPGDLFSDWCVPDRIIACPEDIQGESFDHVFVAYIYEDMRCWNNICNFCKIHMPKVWLNRWFLKNERDYYLDMVRSCGYKAAPPPAYVSIKKPQIGIPDSDLRFCIVPCGKNDFLWRHKKWLCYPELIQILCEKYPHAQIYIIGTKSDSINLDIANTTQVTDMRGLLSLSETAWLMKHSDVVIGNDCGPMHIADAVQAKGIVIFGPTCIIKNGPRNKILPVSINKSCMPCQYNETTICDYSKCMYELAPDKIIEKVAFLLRTK